MATSTDFIEVYDDSAPQELCEELVHWFDACSDNNFTNHNMPFNNGSIQGKVFRSDESISIPNGSVASFSASPELIKAVWEVLTACFNEYIAKYDLGDMRLICYNFKVHKVKQGQGYHVWHHENDHSA